ncbi:MAG: hypothetical protein IT323_22265, partial [Anaerolineae bacterium]|nr:hypothetical protein [Anaerolineae bacterium]
LFVVNLVLFLGNSLAPRVVQDPQLDFIRLVWFVIVVIHGAYALYDLWPFRLVSDLLHRQMDREAERLRAQGYTVIAPAGTLEKPKRAARLADDGEIAYEDEPYSENAPVKRSHTHEGD